LGIVWPFLQRLGRPIKVIGSRIAAALLEQAVDLFRFLTWLLQKWRQSRPIFNQNATAIASVLFFKEINKKSH
jgi:hypothetical protein